MKLAAENSAMELYFSLNPEKDLTKPYRASS